MRSWLGFVSVLPPGCCYTCYCPRYSEIEPHGELRFPHILHDAVDCGDGIDVGNIGVRQRVVRVVESVEHFQTEGQPSILAQYRKAFRQAAVDHVNAGTNQDIASR